MAFPVYVHVLGLRIHPHVFFETLGYLVGFRIYLAQRKRQGDVIDLGTRWSIIATAAVGGLLGSKLLFWFEDPAATLFRLHDPVFLIGGKSIVGGLLGGTLAVEFVKQLIGETRRTGDLFAVPLCLGIAIGRIGCFLSGLSDQTFGIDTSLPWGIDFGDGIHRHPTQLYEAVFLIGLAWLLWRLKFRLQGDLFRAFMVSYLVWRLLIDVVKPEVKWYGLSTIQVSCLLGLMYFAADMKRWFTKPQAERAAA